MSAFWGDYLPKGAHLPNMTTSQIAPRPLLTIPAPAQPADDAFSNDISVERTSAPISPVHPSVSTTIEVAADEVNTSSPSSVWNWAHLRYGDDELDEFDAMLDGKPRW